MFALRTLLLTLRLLCSARRHQGEYIRLAYSLLLFALYLRGVRVWSFGLREAHLEGVESGVLVSVFFGRRNLSGFAVAEVPAAVLAAFESRLPQQGEERTIFSLR